MDVVIIPADPLEIRLQFWYFFVQQGACFEPITLTFDVVYRAQAIDAFDFVE